MAKAAEWFCRAGLRENRSQGHWLVISGDPGCGKTHVASRCHQYISERQIDAYHRGWLRDSVHSPAFLRWDVVADMDDDDFSSIQDRQLSPARFVFIDDLGAETDRFKSGVPMARFKSILDICEHKWLLITTNIGRQDWSNHFDARTTDRLTAARYLSLKGVPSYRAKKKDNEL